MSAALRPEISWNYDSDSPDSSEKFPWMSKTKKNFFFCYFTFWTHYVCIFTILFDYLAINLGIVFKVCFEASFTMSFKFFRIVSSTLWCWQKDNLKKHHKFRYMSIVAWICAANEIVIKNVTICRVWELFAP